MLEKRVETISDDGWKKIIEDFQKLHENEERMELQLEIEEANKQVEEANKRAEVANKQVEEANKRAEVANKRAEEANKRADETDKKMDQMNQLMKQMIQAMLTNGMSLELISKSLSKSEDEIMADLGYHTIDEMVGHTDNLEVDEDANMNYSNILMTPHNIHYEPKDTFNFELEKTVDMKTLLPKFEPYFNEKKPHAETISISSTDRTVGTILSNAVTKQFNNTLEDDSWIIIESGDGQVSGITDSSQTELFYKLLKEKN